jgi:hypothetical protein
VVGGLVDFGGFWWILVDEWMSGLGDCFFFLWVPAYPISIGIARIYSLDLVTNLLLYKQLPA